MNKQQLDKIREALEFLTEQWGYCVENHGTEPMEGDDPRIQQGFDALTELQAELSSPDPLDAATPDVNDNDMFVRWIIQKVTDEPHTIRNFLTSGDVMSEAMEHFNNDWCDYCEKDGDDE